MQVKANRKNSLGIFLGSFEMVVDKSSENTKDGKVAKIKAYLKSELYFLVIFLLAFCMLPIGWQLQGLVDYRSPVSLFIETNCFATLQDNTKFLFLAGIQSFIMAGLVFVFQIIRCLLGSLLILLGVDDANKPDDINPVAYVIILGFVMTIFISMFISSDACRTLKFL